MDESRKQFEEWAISEEGDLDVTKIRNERLGIEAYRSTKTFDAWRGWQAARSLTERSEWQPIETAPANGAPVLALTQRRTIRIETGYYLLYLLEDAKLNSENCNYTHWRELPPPPLASSPSGKPGGEG